MGITIKCDERIDVKIDGKYVKLIWKHCEMMYYSGDVTNAKDFCLSFSCTASKTERSDNTITIDGMNGSYAMIEFPYAMHKLAYDNFLEIVEAFKQVGLVIKE